MSAPVPTPTAPLAVPISGLTTNVEAVLRHVLGRIDSSRATGPSVRSALAAAGVSASEAWCLDWLQRSQEIREERQHGDS